MYLSKGKEYTGQFQAQVDSEFTRFKEVLLLREQAG